MKIRPKSFLARRLVFLVSAFIASWQLCLPALAQSQPAAVSKYLVSSPPPAPDAGTTFFNAPMFTTATPYTWVVTVDFGPSNSTVSIADQLPAGFVATGCLAFLDATPVTVPGCPVVGTIGSSIPFTSIPTSGSHRITLYIKGSFTVGGQMKNTATATLATGVADGGLTVWVETTPPNFNLSVTKTSDHVTAAFGDAIVYTTTVTNTSAVDVPLTNIIALYDRLTNDSSNVEMDVTWGWLNCTSSPATPPSTCFSAPLAQAPVPTTLLPGQSLDLFSTLPNTTTGIPVDPAIASGVLKAGASMAVQYYVQIDTVEPCAPTPPMLKNRSYLGLGGSGGNFPDKLPKDNASEVSVELTGLPTVCPPPPLKITKKVISGPAAWGIPVVYEVEVTSISGVNVSLRYKDLVKGAPATTVFDATPASINCIVFTCVHNPLSTQTWIGSAPKMLFERPASAPAKVLTPGASFKLIYKVTFKATCGTTNAPVTIMNIFDTRGTISGNPVLNFHQVQSDLVTMPALPVCALNVTKTWKPAPAVNPNVPAVFNTTIGTYEIKWTNTSSVFGMKLGTLWDVLSIDDPIYPTVPAYYAVTPVTFAGPGPVCTGVSVSPFNNLLAGLTTTQVSTTANAAQGAQAIRIANVTFSPGGSITCSFTITAHRPLPMDPNCQAQGAPQLKNFALADLDPAFDPNTPPWKTAEAIKLLPLCRNVTITKIATPGKVLPGDPVNWTVIYKNNGPAPNQPISFSAVDIVPPVLLPLSFGPTCGFGTGGASCATNLSAGTINTTMSNLAAGQSLGVIMTSTTPTTPVPSFIKNTVTALDTPGYYYHTETPKGSGNVVTGWPVVTKAFVPNKVFGGNVAVSLNFTVANLSYVPNVTGMSFTDNLPTGLLPFMGATSTNCGPVSTNASGPVGLTNGSLPGGGLTGGTTSCQFSVDVKYNGCGAFSNTPANVEDDPAPVKIDTSQLSATLTVACLKAITGNGATGPTGYGCALYDSGDIKCWGTGPLGRTAGPVTAALVTGNAPAEQIDGGTTHVCTTTKSGNVQCWGGNLGGQLGIGSFTATPLPGPLVIEGVTGAVLANIVEVSAGESLSCAVQTSGLVWCWGRMGNYLPGTAARQVPGITNATSVSVSSTHVCVRINMGTGEAKCWGAQQFGALGNGLATSGFINPNTSNPPVVDVQTTPSVKLDRIVSIKAGDGFTCAIVAPTAFTRRVRCWGYNGTGPTAELLNTTGGNTLSIAVPSFVNGLPTNVRELTVTDSAQGGRHMCITRGPSRQVWCWGENGNSQVGVGLSVARTVPLQLPAADAVATPAAVTIGLDASNGKTCAIVGTGPNLLGAKVQCWGSRALGSQLGDGVPAPPNTFAPMTVPVVGLP